MRFCNGLAAVVLAMGVTGAGADVPSGAVVADTAEKETLISAHFLDTLKGHPEEMRGSWMNTLPQARQEALRLTMAKQSPDKRDEFYTSEFMRAYDAFGDVRNRPYCAFTDLLNEEPLLYGNGVYAFGNAHGNLAGGEVLVNGRRWTGNLDPKKMANGYEAIVAAQKRLGANARFRNCYKFLRVEEIPGRPTPGTFHKRLVLEWLGGDLVDFRTAKVILNIPTSWAFLY